MRAAAGALLAIAATCAGAQMSSLESNVRICSIIPEDDRAGRCVKDLVADMDGTKAQLEESRRAAAEAAKKKPKPKPSEKDIARAAARDTARAQLRESYLRALEALSPSLNHIDVRLEGSRQDGALFGVHNYFSRYSFDIGRLGPGVQAWMDKNSLQLRTACINRVGVADKDGGKVWYSTAYKAPC